MKFDVLGLGCATLDELLFIASFPARESKVSVLRREKQGGGLTATALVAGARLGAQCAYGGQLGFDDISRFVAQTLESEGVATSLVAWRDDAAAIHSLILVEPDGARTIFFERRGALGPTLDSPAESDIAASRVLLVDHYGGPGNTRAIRLARERGVPVVADFERADVPDFDRFFPLVDHLILSRAFASHLTGKEEPQSMARALWNPQRAVVVVTGGEAGAWAFDGAQLTHCAAFPARVVDTTGCGDVWHGAYAATLAWNFPLPERMRWASAAAALKAQHSGAQRGIPTRAAVEQLLTS